MKTPQYLVFPLVAALSLTAWARQDQRPPSAEKPPAAADTNAPPGIRLAGKVVDSEGRAVAGATVEGYQSEPRLPFVPGELERKRRVVTDTDGAFEFTVPRVTTLVLARKAGLAPAWIEYLNPGKDLPARRFVLTTPKVLAGKVLDENGQPFAGAEVFVSSAKTEVDLEGGWHTYPYLGGNPARDCFSSRTSADGHFRIEGFPSNASADLGVHAPGKALRVPEKESTSPLFATPYQPGQEDIQLILEPAGGLEGKVVAEGNGGPLARAHLSLLSDRPVGPFSAHPKTATSGADGTFRLADVAAGAYHLRAVFGTNRVPDWVAATVPVSVESGRTTRDVKVEAVRGGLLAVTVLGEKDRQPIGDANVTAYARPFAGAGRSASNGVALLRLPPGEYQLAAFREKLTVRKHLGHRRSRQDQSRRGRFGRAGDDPRRREGSRRPPGVRLGRADRPQLRTRPVHGQNGRPGPVRIGMESARLRPPEHDFVSLDPGSRAQSRRRSGPRRRGRTTHASTRSRLDPRRARRDF